LAPLALLALLALPLLLPFDVFSVLFAWSWFTPTTLASLLLDAPSGADARLLWPQNLAKRRGLASN